MSLGKLTVNGRQDGFLCEGKPFFWFADTCWSAFTSIAEDDWDYYLTRRAEQGMNVLQINTLPQWDRCCPDLGIWPYASEDGVHFDWSRPNQAYWDRAAAMCRAAVEHGIPSGARAYVVQLRARYLGCQDRRALRRRGYAA